LIRTTDDSGTRVAQVITALGSWTTGVYFHAPRSIVTIHNPPDKSENTPAMLPQRFASLLYILACLSPVNLSADTFKEGGAAYTSGDYDTAVKKFLEVAVKGDHRAMYALGSMYAGGTGVDRDYREAFKWFSKASKYGRPDARYKLALMYEHGTGIPKNYRKAARLYHKAAKKGYAYAQYRLGMLYASGRGVKQNNARGCAWLIVAGQNMKKRSPGQKAMESDKEQSQQDPFAEIHEESITVELQNLKAKLTPGEAEEAAQLAEKYIQYR